MGEQVNESDVESATTAAAAEGAVDVFKDIDFRKVDNDDGKLQFHADLEAPEQAGSPTFTVDVLVPSEGPLRGKRLREKLDDLVATFGVVTGARPRAGERATKEARRDDPEVKPVADLELTFLFDAVDAHSAAIACFYGGIRTSLNQDRCHRFKAKQGRGVERFSIKVNAGSGVARVRADGGHPQTVTVTSKMLSLSGRVITVEARRGDIEYTTTGMFCLHH